MEWFPAFLATTSRSDSLLFIPLHFVSFVPRYHPASGYSLPLGSAPPMQAGVLWVVVSPTTALGGNGRISQVPWGTPCARAPLVDPGGSLGTGRCVRRVLPSYKGKESASALDLSRLGHAAHALPVYASQSRSPFPTQDSVLAASQRCQVGLVAHRVPLRGFCSPISSLPPRPGLTWRTPLHPG